MKDLRPIVEIDIRSLPDYGLLFRLIEGGEHDADVEIHIHTPHLTTTDLLILTSCIVSLLHRGCGVVLLVNNRTANMLESLRLQSLIANWKQTETLESGIINMDHSIIAKVDRPSLVSRVQSVQELLASECLDKDLSMLDLCISELVNNVIDHSNSDEGAFLYCQFIPEKRTVALGVCDFGIGIPQSVNRFFKSRGQEAKAPIDCLKWAIRENNTTLSIPQNLGKGLDNVNSFVRSANSSWSIITDGARLTGTPSGNRYGNNPIAPFVGTAVSLNIQVDSLDDIDGVEAMGW